VGQFPEQPHLGNDAYGWFATADHLRTTEVISLEIPESGLPGPVIYRLVLHFLGEKGDAPGQKGAGQGRDPCRCLPGHVHLHDVGHVHEWGQLGLAHEIVHAIM
jgi:hypothetical protein